MRMVIPAPEDARAGGPGPDGAVSPRQREETAAACGEPCKICDTTVDNHVHLATEQMFGMGGVFRYLECARCGCLQLLNVPDDLDRYYPPGYYSFDAPPAYSRRQLLRSIRTAIALRLGSRVRFLFREHVTPYWLTFFTGRAGLRSRILDVGSGSGGLLAELRHQGFRHLLGVDPYIEQDIEHSSGFWVLKRSLNEVEGPFDFILFNHSLEHMDQPQLVFDQMRRLLAPDGTILIRTPLADSSAWRRYRQQWVQLDAPRHLMVHTRSSINILAARADLRIMRILCDSTAFQFWGSEQYQMGISLESDASYLRNPARAPFSPQALEAFARDAERLNAAGDGDQAAIWLAPAR